MMGNNITHDDIVEAVVNLIEREKFIHSAR